MRRKVKPPTRGLAFSGRPGDMQEFFDVWRLRGFAASFSDFLHEWYASPCAEALKVPPPRKVQPEFRAFLAAVVETLALDHGFEVPDWCFAPEARLEAPICWEVFRCDENHRDLRPIELRSTPTIFRQHGIYVKANVLSHV